MLHVTGAVPPATDMTELAPDPELLPTADEAATLRLGKACAAGAANGLVLHLRGELGAGKTTLLKTLAGLLPPLSGAIMDMGAPAYLPPPGAVSAGFSALHLTALGRAHLRRWAPGLTAEDVDAARRALDRLEVGDLADRPFVGL